MAKHHNKIPPAQLKQAGKIPVPQISTPPTVTFSFKYLDLSKNAKFHPVLCKEGYLNKLLERFKSISSMNINEFRFGGSNAIRCHPIQWDETTEKYGFAPNLKDHEPWQFSISANEHGRIHGFFIANLFCVVWIDPLHKLYSK